jgi:hypothetical protein
MCDLHASQPGSYLDAASLNKSRSSWIEHPITRALLGSRRAISIVAALLIVCFLINVLPTQAQAGAVPTEWFVTPSPNGNNVVNVLTGVSCVTTTDCMAVGWSRTSNGSLFNTLAEYWNGSAWLVLASPGPNTRGFLDGVSCTSATFCVAEGTFNVKKVAFSAMVWNGSTWSAMPSPIPPGGGDLLSVDCVSSQFCAAVGGYGSAEQTVAETWNGNTWTIVPSPNDGFGSLLSSVSCSSPTLCVAVGSDSESPSEAGLLAEVWDGSSWSLTSSIPFPSGSDTGYFSGVSCTSPTDCVAVGTYGAGEPLVETWDGTTWSVTPSENPSGDGPNVLDGVSCTSAANCVASGFENGQILIESWDGSD